MKAQITVKNLVAALAAIKPHVTKVSNTSQTGWTERGAHKLGFDHVLIRVLDSRCTLYAYNTELTRSQDAEMYEPEAYCTFVNVQCQPVEDGSFAVPLKVIFDWVRTLPAAAPIAVTTEYRVLVEDVPPQRERGADGKWHTTSATTIDKSHTRLALMSGRNKCSIVGKTIEEMPCFAFDGIETVEVKPEPIKVSYMHGHKPVVKPELVTVFMNPACGELHWEAIKSRHIEDGVSYYVPLGNPPGYILHDNRELDNAAAIWQAYQYMLSLHANYAITDGDGNVIAPLGPAQTAPTPIYTPAVGDSVFVVVSHTNGTTTDRVIDVTRLMPNGVGFRGHDRRYGRTRNFYTAQLAVLRQWDGLEVYGTDGNVVIAAA